MRKKLTSGKMALPFGAWYILPVENQITGRGRRPKFIHSVVCSALIDGAWVMLPWSTVA